MGRSATLAPFILHFQNMRTTIVLAALAASALAAPRPVPQDVNFADVLSDFAPFTDDLPMGPEYGANKETIPAVTPPTSDIVDNIKTDPATPGKVRRRDVSKRTSGDCAPQQINTGPQFDGTPAEWTALVQNAYPPNNPSTIGPYTKVFDGLIGSVNQMGYLGLTTINSYDLTFCRNKCDTKVGCLGFNLYVERNPSLNPGPGCPNPAPITNYKCTLWGFPFLAGAADNTGQTRTDFKVVIAASVAYVKPYTGSCSANFTVYGSNLYGAINAPKLSGSYPPYQIETYLGRKQYPSDGVSLNFFDPCVCSRACDSQTNYNCRHPPSASSTNPDSEYKKCNYFNVYILSNKGKAQGMVCSLYTNVWDSSYAVNGGDGDDVKVLSSYTFANNRDDPSFYDRTKLTAKPPAPGGCPLN
ncbi:hypothetical protein Dda_4239 [Drechslerella dactyloides]|uniref:Uncharacterized protein n=1 Tax=Drechslerella dactyloides TaxID=74499 RepID=A0AAD6IZD6_DREDA|nr:hypothetical protein Dda_4239 [Drechslerella dactyloides]